MRQRLAETERSSHYIDNPRRTPDSRISRLWTLALSTQTTVTVVRKRIEEPSLSSLLCGRAGRG
jgi:hypothetical protein